MYVERSFEWYKVHPILEKKIMKLRRRRPEKTVVTVVCNWLGFRSRWLPRVCLLSVSLAVDVLTVPCKQLNADVCCHVLNETLRFTFADCVLIMRLLVQLVGCYCIDSACVCLT